MAQALLRAPDDSERFARVLAWRLRLWLLPLPVSIGRATLARGTLRDSDSELDSLLETMEDHLKRQAPPAEFANALGLQRGVSGYVYHTVLLCLYCWLRSPGDFRRAVEEVITLGGDADTTGAIVGATVAAQGIPPDWIAGIWDWPISASWMRQLATHLAEQFGEPRTASPTSPTSPSAPPLFWWPALLPRNLLFFLVVLMHQLRRLLPPC